MSVVAAVARESGSHSCVSDQRPGPHAGSVSETEKDTATQSAGSSTEFKPRMGAVRLAVPSKSGCPSAVVDGVRVCVKLGVSDGV